ncbi:hypothetical protein SCMC78_19870 [Streptomyces sp. CMC78]|uniref:Uncharacterized protein n=1 Tax=Streptomyces sp. CMC78 TaxID=3231512 RepID=A0AB33KKU7_9ACTN
MEPEERDPPVTLRARSVGEYLAPVPGFGRYGRSWQTGTSAPVHGRAIRADDPEPSRN